MILSRNTAVIQEGKVVDENAQKIHERKHWIQFRFLISGHDREGLVQKVGFLAIGIFGLGSMSKTTLV